MRDKNAPFLTTREAMEYLGIARSTFVQTAKLLNIEGKTFGTGHTKWYARKDLELIEAYRKQPYRVDELRKKDESSKNVVREVESEGVAV